MPVSLSLEKNSEESMKRDQLSVMFLAGMCSLQMALILISIFTGYQLNFLIITLSSLVGAIYGIWWWRASGKPWTPIIMAFGAIALLVGIMFIK